MTDCRSSELSDLHAIAGCHARAFPDALAVKHGLSFTKRMLEWYIVSERGVLFHIECDGEVVGYCGAIRVHSPGLPGAFTSISQYAFRHFVLSYLRRPWLFFHRENMKKLPAIWRNIKLRLGLGTKVSQPVAARESFSPNWGLVVIGVAPAFHGHGYGWKLLQEFERRAADDGVKRVVLSVKADNTAAIASYKRNGWNVQQALGDSLNMYKSI